MTFLIASITPVIIFLYLIYRKDTIKEPKAVLAKCFFGGFLSIALALLIDVPMSAIGDSFSQPLLKSFWDAFLVASAPEELSKFLILYWLVWKSKDFDQHYDGITYAVFVSMGFALIENILYVFQGGLGVALARSVLSVPGHGFFAVLMGYYFSMARFAPAEKRRKLLVKSLAMPILFHGLYDFALIYISTKNSNVFLVIVLMIVFTYTVIKLWRLGIKKVKLHVQHDKTTMLS
jgi:RsiW-degrading membrane proteinase PrsW (M82 family)